MCQCIQVNSIILIDFKVKKWVDIPNQGWKMNWSLWITSEQLQTQIKLKNFLYTFKTWLPEIDPVSIRQARRYMRGSRLPNVTTTIGEYCHLSVLFLWYFPANSGIGRKKRRNIKCVLRIVQHLSRSWLGKLITLQTSRTFLIQKMFQKTLRICPILTPFFDPKIWMKIWNLFKISQVKKS